MTLIDLELMVWKTATTTENTNNNKKQQS